MDYSVEQAIAKKITEDDLVLASIMSAFPFHPTLPERTRVVRDAAQHFYCTGNANIDYGFIAEALSKAYEQVLA